MIYDNDIKKAKNSNLDFINKILDEYSSWCIKSRNLTKKYKVNPDEIESIARFAVLEAIRIHNFNSGYTFRQTIITIFRDDILTVSNRNKKQIKTKLLSSYDLNQTILTKKIKEVKPCIECGTLGGYIRLNRISPIRIKGYCASCYDKFQVRLKGGKNKIIDSNYNPVGAPVKPCIECGTLGGLIHQKCIRPMRIKGLCHSCYNQKKYIPVANRN